jgi:hypothetical protein
MTYLETGLSIVIILLIYVLMKLHEIAKPVTFYMKVFMCLRAETDPTNAKKQGLMERVCNFRIVPRVGDTLHFDYGHYPVVSEVQLRHDGRFEIWCDEIVSDSDIENRRTEYENKGWRSPTHDPKFRPKVDVAKLSQRSE